MSDDQLQGNVKPQEPAERPIDPGTTIGHVHLRTADIDRVKAFYVGILGFNTWKSADGPPQADGHTGLHHIAIAYPTRGGLADAYARLKEAGIPIRQATDHGTHEAIYITDPDGNDVELMWDRPFDQWPTGELGPFSMNTDLDLDALLKAA